MFAILKTGGKQYRVAVGDQLTVERINADVGTELNLTQVLALGGDGNSVIGKPFVADATVTARIVAHSRGTKVIVFKKKRRKNYRRKRGHRQELTTLRIMAIGQGGAETAPEPTPVEAEPASV